MMTKNEWLDSLTDENYEIYDDLAYQLKDIEAEIAEKNDILRNPLDYLNDEDWETQSDINRYTDAVEEEISSLEDEADEIYQKMLDFEAANGFEAA